MKDFAESYEQKNWAMHVADYERMKGYIKRAIDYPHSAAMLRMADFAVRRIEEIEAKYPQLKAK